VPSLCEFYPGICLTTEEKARVNLSQGKKNLSQVKKNLGQSTVNILPKHPHVTKKHTYTHSLQDNINPPQSRTKIFKYMPGFFSQFSGYEFFYA